MGTPTLQFDDTPNLLGNKTQARSIDVHSYTQLILYYIELLLRLRWILIVSLFIAFITGIYLAVTVPKIYQAETLILIEPQRVPNNFVTAIVPTDLSVHVNTIKEMIMSRTNILKIIENFNLFSGPEYSSMFLDDKVEAIRTRTSVDIVRGGRKATNAFKISFRGKEPKEVVEVVNTMALLVIDQNLKVRESQAVATVEFLEHEMVKVRGKLEEVEAALKDFRINHMGELPDQLDSNLTVLQRLQQQLSEKQRNLRDEKNRLISIENQIQLAREQAALTLSAAVSSENGAPTTLEGSKTAIGRIQDPLHPTAS